MSTCAWCGCSIPSNGVDDSPGICDSCMETVFGVDPASIHAEIDDEEVA
jgi:hypothetical protein